MSAGDVEERIAMLRRLAGADPHAAELYLQQALQEREPELRIAALELVGQYHLTTLLDELLGALTDRAASVRVQAVESLGMLGVYEAVDPLSRMLADAEPGVRVAAIRALSRTGSPAASSAIALALHDRDRDIATAAAEALGRLGSTSAVFALLEESGSPDEAVAVACIDALAAIADPRASAALVEASRDGQRPAVAVAAVHALGALDSEDAARAVAAQLLAPSHPDVQVAALQVISSMASPGALASMLQLVQARTPASVDRLEYNFIELCIALGPQAWAPLAEAWSRTNGQLTQSNITLLRGWLASGDPDAVAVLDAAHRLGEIDVDYHADLLRHSNTESALCRRLQQGHGVEQAMALAIRSGLDACLTDAVQQHGLPSVEAVRSIISDGAFVHTSGNIEILSAMLAESRAGWDEIFPLLNELPRDRITTWRRLLEHPDTRVAREAGFVLGDAADASWPNADLRAVLQLGQSRPWVLKAMRSAPSSALCPLVENDELWAYADPAVSLERLELAVGCSASFSEQLARASVNSDDLWLRRRARALLGDPVEAGELSPEFRVAHLAGLAPANDIDSLLLLADDADPIVRAAALFRLVESPSPAFTEGDLVVRVRNARTAAEEAALRVLLTTGYPDASSLGGADDPMVAAVLSGRQVAPEGRLVVGLSDAYTGRPLVNGPLLVVFADGTVGVERTDREGRWSTERPVAFVFHRWNS